jgi:hypothetical protein
MFCIIQIGDFIFSMNTSVSVTVSVLNHHHLTCVCLLHSTYQQGEFSSVAPGTCHVLFLNVINVTVYSHRSSSVCQKQGWANNSTLLSVPPKVRMLCLKYFLPVSYPVITGSPFPLVKRSGRETDHSLSSAEVQNSRCYTASISYVYRVRGLIMDSDNFIYNFTF